MPIQARLARDCRVALNAGSKANGQAGPEPQPTANAEAYGYYLQGNSLTASGPFDTLKLAGAARALQQLEEVGPDLEETHAARGRLDPANAEVAATLGQVLTALRRYDEAEHYLDRAISLVPDNRFYYNAKWRLLTLGTGDTARALRVVEQAGPHIRPDDHLWQKSLIAEFRRDYPAAIEGIRHYAAPAGSTTPAPCSSSWCACPAAIPPPRCA